MGYIKGRFGCLRGLRQQTSALLHHEHALVWVKTCIVIHTLVSIIEHGREDEDFIAKLIEEGRDLRCDDGGRASHELSDAQQETRGKCKRTQLKDFLFDNIEFI